MSSPRRDRTLLAVALAVAVVLVAVVPLAGAAPGPSARAAGPPACRTVNLVVWLANPKGNGAAGSVYYKLEFTNLGGGTCSLDGAPGVVAANLGGRRIGAVATRETGAEPKLVKVRSGETASAALRVVSPGVFSPSECHPVTAAGVRVTPPGGSGSRLVPFPFETCARVPGEPALTVGPVR